MERAYREDELIDATIIDSEGYIYGKVEKITVNEDEILLLAYEEKPDVKTVVDVKSLKESLLGEIKPKMSRFRKMLPEDVLAENIRKDLGLTVDEQLGDEHYVRYAERMGVAVPQVKASVPRKEQKGTVSFDEVKTMEVTVIGKEKATKIIKIILLKEPKEAEFRKIPIQKKVTYKSTDVIKDKLVLDAEGKALGYVDSVVLFQGTPGIRVYVSKMSGQVSLALLTRYLEESGQSDAAAQVRKHLADPESHRYTVEVEELEDFMHKRKLSFRLPEKVLSSQSSKDFVADIPWDAVSKIGDVVLLKSTLADLRSKGHL